MQNKHLLSHVKPGGRTFSVLVTLLVTAMTLLPQSVCGQATDYELTVAGVKVTSDNAANITGQYLSEGTAVFDASSNTLALSNVKIGYGGVQSGLENLTIVFNGTNIIESYIGANTAVAGSHNLTLQSGSEGSTMYLANTVEKSIIDGFDNISMDGLYVSSNDTPFAYDETAKQFKGVQISGVILQTATITSIPHYSLWVGNTQLNDENKDDVFPNDQSLAGKVSFDNSSKTLSLQNVDLPYNVFSALNNLTIDVSGNCKVGSGDSATAVRNVHSSSTLTLKSTGTGNQLSFSNNRPIRDFSSITLTGLYWDDDYTYGPVTFEDWDGEKQAVVELVGMHLLKSDGSEAAGAIATSAIPYQLKVAGTQVNSENAADVLGDGTVSFNADNNTLTLNNLDVTSYDYDVNIQSGLSSLTIHFKGSNSLVSITSSNEDATLTFGKVTTAESADLDLSANDEAVISGFASIDLGDMKWMYEGAPLIYKNKALVSASTGEPATWAALSSQGMEEEPILWIDDSPIVGNDTDGGDQTPATWSFVAETKTLTLSGASLSSPIITNFAGTLNIVLSGTNTIQNTGGTILPAAFVAYKSGVSLAFQEVEAATSAAKLSMTTTSAFDGFAKVSYSGNLALKKSNSGYEISNNSSGYGITIITGTNDGDIQITPSNRESILNGKIKFDGKNTLILDGATFAGISIESTNTLVDGLNVYLKGDNRIENGTNAINNYSSSMPLSIETDDIDPGTLIYINSTCSLKVANQAFSNFEPIAYKKGLVATLDYTDDEISANNSEITYDDPNYIRSQTVTIAVTMNPIVDAIENKQVDVVGDLKTQGGSIPTTGVVLDNVLYTLSADGDGITVTDASGNAIPPVDQTVGITTTMTEEDVNTIAGRLADETLVPGTLEFAAAFKGMTFLLPAGTGNIIINVRTNESGTLAVKIGNQPAVTFDEAKTAFGELVVPFACSVPTYVLIYNQRAATESRELDSHRAPGRKETATVEIKGLSVSASSVVAVPEPALSPVMLDKSAVAKVAGKHFIKVDNPDVAGVDADAFVAVKEDKELTYVDLTNTGIKGITVDRSTDAFQNVPEKAFIYLPAGNKVKTGTKNVIIGSVCEDMEMADDAPYFEMAQDFTARNVKQNRDYKDFVGKNCTVYLPFAIDAETAASLGTFYKLKGYDGTTVSMESVTETKANTPYMFKPKAADTKVAAKMVKVEATPAEAPVVGKAGKMIKFVGTYEQKDIVSDDGSSTQYYCFMADGAEAGKFVRVITTPVTMNPYRAYMVVEGGADARELDLVIDGVSTGIKNMKVGTDDNVYYDLQGRRVLYPTKGLYIVNGRKVIIK